MFDLEQSLDQPDPYSGSYNAADPQSLNRYSYVQNDPVNYVDPTGLLAEDRVFMWQWQNMYEHMFRWLSMAGDGIARVGGDGLGGSGGGDPQNNKLAPNGLGSDKKLSDAECDKKLSAIFGGNAFAMVNNDIRGGGRGGYGHDAVARNDLPKYYTDSEGKRYRNYDRGGIIHTYTDGTGSERSDVGLYAPSGWSGTPVSYYSNGNSGLRFRYSTGLTISFVHVGTTNANRTPSLPVRSLGSTTLIGTVGGYGGQVDGYSHTHIIFYSNFKNDVRVDPRKVFCGF